MTKKSRIVLCGIFVLSAVSLYQLSNTSLDVVHVQTDVKPYHPPIAAPTVEDTVELAQKPFSAIVSLKLQIQTFWQQCQLAGNCSQQLAQLKTHMQDSDYLLLSEYPAKQEQLHNMLDLQLTDEVDSLGDKIQLIKTLHQHLWQDQSSMLFAQEYADYALQLSMLELSEQNSESSHAQKLQSFDLWLQARLSDGDIEASKSYSQALQFFADDLNGRSAFTLKSQLAKKYLKPDRAEIVIVRQQQLAEQQYTVDQYQQGLKALKNELDQQQVRGDERLLKIQTYRLNYFSK